MKDCIIEEIKLLVHRSALNASRDQTFRYFDEPLIGFASAVDPLFDEYKEKIGDVHLLPLEWLGSELGLATFHEGTVISWILPINEEVLASNRKGSDLPSRQWAHVRFFGQQFNDTIAQHVVGFLTKAGFHSVAPSLSSRWERFTSEKAGRASNWSERHAAYAAGLGTFSLTDALITERGAAHRCGSVITDLVLEPTARPYQGIRDYCLFYTSQKCGVCIKRCPAGALSHHGHDKDLCFNYTRQKVMPTVNDAYGVTTSSCGLCQTGVPCEKRIPGSAR